MKVPKIGIKKNDNIIRYYIYRDTSDKLPNDISSYNKKEPVGCIFNTSSTPIPMFLDNRETVQDGVDKYFSNPVTICSPKVDCGINLSDIVGGGKIPYYNVIVKGINENVLLHYRVLSDNSSGSVSDLSDIVSVEISQNVKDIESWIEYKTSSGWVKLQDVIQGKEYDLFKLTTQSSYNIFDSGIYKFKDTDIVFQNKYSRSDNIVIVSLKNIWHSTSTSIHYRDTKPLRACATLNDGNILYSDIFNSKKQYSPIDKVVVIRKEHDGTNNHLTIRDDKITVKQIIRAGGIYSTKEIESIQFNERTITGDFGLVNFDNKHNEISLVDKGIMHGKKYKYTFICYDSTGQQSSSYTVKNMA